MLGFVGNFGPTFRNQSFQSLNLIDDISNGTCVLAGKTEQLKSILCVPDCLQGLAFAFHLFNDSADFTMGFWIEILHTAGRLKALKHLLKLKNARMHI